MQLSSLIGKLQSPPFQAVVAIAQHAGGGMTVARFQSFRFPTGVCQVWEFTPALPPLDRPPVVVAVFLRRGRLETWTPVAESGFEAAVQHYTELAAASQRPTGALPAAAAPARLAVPELPPGVRIVAPMHSKPLTIGGKPVAVAAPGGAP